jgi:hypothetical protein
VAAPRLQERFNKTIPFAKVLGKLNQLDVDSWVGRRWRLWKHCLEPSSPTVVRVLALGQDQRPLLPVRISEHRNNNLALIEV